MPREGPAKLQDPPVMLRSSAMTAWDELRSLRILRLAKHKNPTMVAATELQASPTLVTSPRANERPREGPANLQDPPVMLRSSAMTAWDELRSLRILRLAKHKSPTMVTAKELPASLGPTVKRKAMSMTCSKTC